MNIIIDGRFVTKNMAGSGYYSYNLIRSLLSKGLNENFYIFILKNSIDLFYPLINKKTKFLTSSIFFSNHPWEEIWENFYLPIKLKTIKYDIFHIPHYNVPLLWQDKFIITIHDLIPFIYPETYPLKFRMYVQFRIKKAIKKASKIIAISETTKNDLIQILKVHEDKIAVIYPGCNILNIKNETPKQYEKYDIKCRYILSVGTIEPRKNHIRLIKAFELLKKEYKEEIKLVIVGQKGWLYQNIMKEIETNKDIIYLGYLTKEELLIFYQKASVFIYPSLYEGFGLPLLEAMKCGVPIISSHLDVIKEVVDDAAILINPEKIEEIKEAMYKILTCQNIKDKLVAKGLERVKKFSWKKTAQETLKVYNELVFQKL